MKKTITFIAVLLLTARLPLSAQGLTIDKVQSVVLRNSGSIIENEQVKGYYFFYQSDKIDKKTNEYTLQIVDENLNKLKDVKFTDSKDIVLRESSFNGSSIVFLFYNTEEKTLEYRLFGLDGKQSYTYTKILDKKTVKYMAQQDLMNKSEDTENKNIFDINGKGFLSITPIREDKFYTYDINFYASGKRRTWTYNPVEQDKVTEAHYLGANDSIAIIEVLSKKSRTAKDMESTLLGLNLETGKKAFEIRTQDGKHQFYPMNISTLNGNGSEFVLIGPYYEGDDRVGDKSDGLGVWVMNNQGKRVKSKYVSWNKELSKYVKVSSNGKVEDMGWVYFHKLVQTDDGKIFAIGEGYKKVADGFGIAASVLSGSYSGVTKMVITNMMMLEFSPSFDLVQARIYEKNKNHFSLGLTSDFISPHLMASVAKAWGYFDYNYTQLGKNGASFMSTYSDFEKSKDYRGQTFNAISYYDGKITTDKINLSSRASKLRVLPAKPGTALIMEYFKKEKRLDFRLEKLN